LKLDSIGKTGVGKINGKVVGVRFGCCGSVVCSRRRRGEDAESLSFCLLTLRVLDCTRDPKGTGLASPLFSFPGFGPFWENGEALSHPPSPSQLLEEGRVVV